jgi:hypothetical protein
MEMMNPNEIKTHPSFEKLFPIKDELLQAIEDDMRENEFDLSQPVVLAKWEGQEEFVCLDGHTRVQAAIKAGIDKIPVWEREDFETKEDALECAVKLQCHRRNLPDSQIMYYIGLMDAAKAQQRSRRSSTENPMPHSCGNTGGRSASAKKDAELLGCSPRKVEQLRTVMNHADPEIIQAVHKGEMSGNRAYQETQRRRKEARAAESRLESAPERTQMEPTARDDQPNHEEVPEAPQAEVPDWDAEKDDYETDAGEPGQAEPVESEGLEEQLDSAEQTDEDGYVNVRIRLAQYEALSQYGLTAEEAIDDCLQYRRQEECGLAEYEDMWASCDADDEDDMPDIDAA